MGADEQVYSSHPQTASYFSSQGLNASQLDLYGRQVLLPEIGTSGQKNLIDSKVVVVGAGGLGSSACLYLATSGVGNLTIVDGDDVAITNLQRQIIHETSTVGCNKATSAVEACRRRNPLNKLEAVPEFLTPENFERILSCADVVVDATDNAKTRYLINDACVYLKKPLVSGSALRWEGQLSVYNFNEETRKRVCTTPTDIVLQNRHTIQSGPCYRCIFPHPPPINNTGSCDMEGVIGPAPGTIGVLQALEALKICLGLDEKVLAGRLLIFDGLDPNMMWRTVKLRGPQKQCLACGYNGPIDPKDKTYGASCVDFIYPVIPTNLSLESRQFVSQFLSIKNDSEKGFKYIQVTPDVVIVDVRPKAHFDAFHFEGAVNVPIVEFLDFVAFLSRSQSEANNNALLSKLRLFPKCSTMLLFLCRRGRDSARATEAFVAFLQQQKHSFRFDDVKCRNVTGGLLKIKETVEELKDMPYI